MWDEIAVRLDDFLTGLGPSDSPPAIAEFLPAHPAAVRRLMLEELVKADLNSKLNVRVPAARRVVLPTFPSWQSTTSRRSR